MSTVDRPVYLIDGDRFDTFAGFIAACNEAFIRQFGGDWNGNLDALNDYLWWSHGSDGGAEYMLVWKRSEKSRADFETERGKEGRRLFHTLVEIVRSQDHVELRLE